MKIINLLLLMVITACINKTIVAQQISYPEWQKMAATKSRMLPKYGGVARTPEEKENDDKFVNSILTMEQFKGDTLAASNHMITLGFKYYYTGDLVTAMSRFNQAYLIDSTNSDIYWGFGAVYTSLGALDEAKSLYESGLKMNPKNTNILTDLGTYYLQQYYMLIPLDKKWAAPQLDSAINYLLDAYKFNPQEINATYKLSICYWLKEDCTSAWEYYRICEKLGGTPITKEFTKDLKKDCQD